MQQTADASSGAEALPAALRPGEPIPGLLGYEALRLTLLAGDPTISINRRGAEAAPPPGNRPIAADEGEASMWSCPAFTVALTEGNLEALRAHLASSLEATEGPSAGAAGDGSSSSRPDLDALAALHADTGAGTDRHRAARGLARAIVSVAIADAAVAFGWCPPGGVAGQRELVEKVAGHVLAWLQDGSNATAGEGDLAILSKGGGAADLSAIFDPYLVEIDRLIGRQALQAEAMLLLARLDRATGREAVRMNTFEARTLAFRPGAAEVSRATEQSMRLLVLIMHRMARFRDPHEDLPERLNLRRAEKQATDDYFETELALRQQVVRLFGGNTAASRVEHDPQTVQATADLLDPGLISMMAGHADRLWECAALRMLYSRTLAELTRWRPDLERDLAAAAERVCAALARDLLGDDDLVLALDITNETAWSRIEDAETAVATAGPELQSLLDDLVTLEIPGGERVQERLPRFGEVLDRLRRRWAEAWVDLIGAPGSARRQRMELPASDTGAGRDAEEEVARAAEATWHLAHEDLLIFDRAVRLLADAMRGLGVVMRQDDPVVADVLGSMRLSAAEQRVIKNAVDLISGLLIEQSGTAGGLSGNLNLQNLIRLVERDQGPVLLRGALARHADVMQVRTTAEAGMRAAARPSPSADTDAGGGGRMGDMRFGGREIEWLGPDREALARIAISELGLDVIQALPAGAIPPMATEEADLADRARSPGERRREIDATVGLLRSRWALLARRSRGASTVAEPLL